MTSGSFVLVLGKEGPRERRRKRRHDRRGGAGEVAVRRVSDGPAQVAAVLDLHLGLLLRLPRQWHLRGSSVLPLLPSPTILLRHTQYDEEMQSMVRGSVSVTRIRGGDAVLLCHFFRADASTPMEIASNYTVA